MVEGMEFVSGLIVQYAVVEQLYTSYPSQLIVQLKMSLTELYVSILDYLFHAYKYFGYNKLRRALSGVNKSMNGEVDHLWKKITEAKIRVDADASLIHHDLTQSGISLLAREQASLAGKGVQVLERQALVAEQQNHILIAQEDQAKRSRILVEILQSWQRPLHLLSSQVLDVHEVMDQAKNTKISDWISKVRVDAHHAAIRDGRLPSSGKWLLRHAIYQDWARAPRSSVLWMHGLLGTGKTNLISTVIDEYQIERREARNEYACLAYFYCSRNKAGFENVQELSSASEAGEIFRSLLKQLVKTERSKEIDVSITDKYQQLKADVDEPRRLTMSECIELIISISWNKAITIIIDALDECRSANVRDLLKGLDEIVTRSPQNVKVFLSTRPVSGVIDSLRDKPYASLEVSADQNGDDISNFITHELDSRIREKQLLHGLVSDDLRRDILLSLSKRAGSMFWYANLQLNLLCDPTAELDESSVRARLTELPATLKEAYTGILDEITSSKNSQSSREVAQNILKWLLCAQEPMPSETFLEAVSSVPHQHLNAEWASSICRSLVILDKENDVFEFAHLSVREHMEQAEHYTLSECNIVAAESCLRALEIFSTSTAMNRAIPDSTQAFRRYASLYWPFHFQKIDFRDTDDRKTRLKNKLKTLLVRMRDVSPIFQQWISDVESMANHFGANNERLLKLDSLKAVPATPLFVASIFGFADLIKQFRLIKGYNLEQTNLHRQTPLCLAVENDQMETAQAFLENSPRARVSPVDVNHVNTFAVEQFETLNLNSPPKVICFATALQAAAFTGNGPIAEYLLKQGARVDVVAGYYGTALQAAALNGHAGMVKFLLEQYDAEPNNQGGYYGNALQAAAVSGDLSTVSVLVDHGAVVWMPGGHYGSAFMAAVDSRSRNVAELLLYNQAEINKASKYYGTPLQRAAELDSHDIVELLITEGAEMCIQVATESHEVQLTHSSALAAAAWGGHTKIVSVLLKNGAQADISHQHGELHILHRAASTGMLDLARYCIEDCGCYINMSTDQLPSYISAGVMTPLSFACSEGQTQMVRYLLSKTAGLESGSDHCPNLWLAARRGHSAILQILLEHSVARLPGPQHLDLLNRRVLISGQTALHEAAQIGSTESVDLLLAYGASLRLNSQDCNPLHSAVVANRTPVVRILVHHVCNGLQDISSLDVQDELGAPPLFHAAILDNVHIVRILLAAGANVSVCDRKEDSVFHIAAKLGRAQIMQELLKYRDSESIRPQLHLANAAGNTPLVEAIASNSENGHDAAVLLLQRGASWRTEGNQFELLHQAVVEDISLLRKYLTIFANFPHQRRCFLESRDREGNTALHVAASTGNCESLELLLQNGAPSGSSNAEWQTSPSSPIMGVHDHCTQQLPHAPQEQPVKATPFVDLRNARSNTALHEAVINTEVSAISWLIEYEADVMSKGDEGRNALFMALKANDFDDAGAMVAALLRKAIESDHFETFIDCRTSTGTTALFEACERGMNNIAEMLVIHGASISISNSEGLSPLHVTACNNSSGLAKTMLEHVSENGGPQRVQALIDQRSNSGMTALNEACRKGDRVMLELLMGRFKADYTLAAYRETTYSGYTPLHFLLRHRDILPIRTFLDHIACDSDGEKTRSLLNAYHSREGKQRTALLEAAYHAQIESLELLLAAGADYLLADEDKCTALHRTVSKNDEVATHLLLKFASQDNEERCRTFLNQRNKWGKTALMYAVEKGYISTVEFLLGCPGINYAARDLNGFTALHWGTCRDRIGPVNTLLNFTCKDRIEDYRNFINHRAHMNGVSALFGAATAGQALMSKILLERGADYYTFDNSGQNPLHMAVKQDFFEVVQLYLDFASRDEDLQRCRNFMTADDPSSALTLGELAEESGSMRTKGIIRNFFLSPLYQETLPKKQLTFSRSATGL